MDGDGCLWVKITIGGVTKKIKWASHTHASGGFSGDLVTETGDGALLLEDGSTLFLE
jgi:hypothetical protein